MKKIILSIVGTLAVLWIALFVSDSQVLVWETKTKFPVNWTAADGKKYRVLVSEDFKALSHAAQIAKLEERMRQKNASTSSINPFLVDISDKAVWLCFYFNGRRLIGSEFPPSHTACPNFRENR